MCATCEFVARQRYGTSARARVRFVRDERTFASSDGSFITQTVYNTGGTFEVQVKPNWKTHIAAGQPADFFTNASAGWEYVERAPFRDRALELIERAEQKCTPTPVEIGRYDVIFDAAAVAGLLRTTVGQSTLLDRAMGYTANTSGTSYLSDPLAMLGAFRLGAPAMTVTADRTQPDGASTAQWDAEGVQTSAFPLVREGMLADFQTTRESAAWLAPFYQRANRPVQSNGCAGGGSAGPLIHWPANLQLEPSTDGNTSFDDLVAGTSRGMAIMGGPVYTDQQGLNGGGRGDITYEVRDGKLGRVITGAEYLFRSPELWKTLVALGGAGSRAHFGTETRYERYAHSVSAVPAKFREVTIVARGQR
jgi:TldD protein